MNNRQEVIVSVLGATFRLDIKSENTELYRIESISEGWVRDKHFKSTMLPKSLVKFLFENDEFYEKAHREAEDKLF